MTEGNKLQCIAVTSVCIALLVCGAVIVSNVVLFPRRETVDDRVHLVERLDELSRRVRSGRDGHALNKIVEHLRGSWSFAATSAATCLGELGPHARPALPDLIWALNCGNPFVERESALALGSVGKGLAAPVPALIEKLSEEDNDAGWFAAESLGEIGRPALSAIPALQRAAKSKNAMMAQSASAALTKLRELSVRDVQ